MLGGSPMIDETVRACADSGVGILSIESLSLTPELRRADYESVLESGARLQARFLNVIGDDPDLNRARDTFAALASAASEYGLRTALEPIFHRAIGTLAQAIDVIDGAPGGAIQVDVLHFYRMGATLPELRSIDPSRLSYLQVDDGPAAAPATLDLRSVESRSGRLLPGAGELAIVDVIEAMPIDTAIAVEVTPPADLTDDAAFLRAAFDAGTRLLTDVDTRRLAQGGDRGGNRAN
jgi:sugar phosphate isomerase/epimerase